MAVFFYEMGHIAFSLFESHHRLNKEKSHPDWDDFFFSGVGNGTRTHNAWNHNPVLCQLNYTHHIFIYADWLPWKWQRSTDEVKPTKMSGTATGHGHSSKRMLLGIDLLASAVILLSCLA